MASARSWPYFLAAGDTLGDSNSTPRGDRPDKVGLRDENFHGGTAARTAGLRLWAFVPKPPPSSRSSCMAANPVFENAGRVDLNRG